MSSCNCSLCKKAQDDADAAVLTVSAVGNKRYICKECEEVLTLALKSREVDEIADAMAKLGEIMTESDVEDGLVIEQMNALLDAARERAEQIRAGEYDFSLDEEEMPEELPELLAQTEPEPELSDEERARLEKRERVMKIVDKVCSWLSIALVAGVVIYFIITLIL